MKYKAIYKSITWRVIATSVTAASSYFFTGNLGIAVSILSVDFITKFILYYLHEKAWEKDK